MREKYRHKLAAFELDERIKLSIEYDLAATLGRIILDSDTQNTAILALGHQLCNLVDQRPQDEEEIAEDEYEDQ